MYLFTYTISYIWLKISRPAWLVCTTKGRLWGLLTPLLLAWALCFLIPYAVEISPPWIKLPWPPCLPFLNGLCPWRLRVKINIFLTLLLSGSATAVRGASEINGDGTKKGWDFQLRWKHRAHIVRVVCKWLKHQAAGMGCVCMTSWAWTVKVSLDCWCWRAGRKGKERKWIGGSQNTRKQKYSMIFLKFQWSVDHWAFSAAPPSDS